MYRTSHHIRILSAALAAVVGIGLVATAGGALSKPSGTSLQLVRLDTVVVTQHSSARVAAGCSEAPKAAL